VYLNAVGGVEQFIASQAIALALQGVPAVYFNSLVGAENWEEGVQTLGYNRAINRQKFQYDALSRDLEDGSSTKHVVHEAYTNLLRVRRGEPLFNPLVQQIVLSLDPRVFALIRSDGQQKLLAMTNVSDSEVTLDAARLREQLSGGEVQNLLSGEQWPLDGELQLKPYETVWLK